MRKLVSFHVAGKTKNCPPRTAPGARRVVQVHLNDRTVLSIEKTFPSLQVAEKMEGIDAQVEKDTKNYDVRDSRVYLSVADRKSVV